MKQATTQLRLYAEMRDELKDLRRYHTLHDHVITRVHVYSLHILDLPYYIYVLYVAQVSINVSCIEPEGKVVY